MSNDKLAQALRRIKSNLMHQRRFGVDDMGHWRRAAAQAEGDLEEALATHEAEKQAGPVAWVRWDGGACPIPWGTQVHVRHRTGREYGPCRAGESYAESWGHNGWSSDIVAYRLAAPPSESDKEDAERYLAIKASLYAENITIGEAYLTLRVVGVPPDVSEWDAAIDAIRAARAKKEQS